MKNHHDYLHKLPIAFLAIILFCTLASIIWASGRSFGLSDEGLYLLAARYPEEIRENVSATYLYTGFIFRLANYDVAMFRIFGLALIVLSACVFWCGYCKFTSSYLKSVAEIRYFRLLSFCFIQTGGLLYYQWSLATPSYYTLTSVAVNAFSGALLFGLGAQASRTGWRLAFLSFLLAGLLIGFAAFVKFPTGFVLLLLSVVVVGSWKSLSSPDRLIFALAILSGFGFWVIGHFVFVDSLETTWNLFRTGWELYQTLGRHAPREKLLAYPTDLIVFTISALKNYSYCYVILIALLIFNRTRKFSLDDARFRFYRGAIAFVLTLAVLLSLEAGIFVNDQQRYKSGEFGLTQFYVSFYLAWILLLVAIHDLLNRLRMEQQSPVTFATFEYRAILLFLMLLPIAAAIGTSNPIYNVASFYAVPWFGIIFFLLAVLVIRLRFDYRLLTLSVLLLSAFSASQTIQGSIFAPALLPSPGLTLMDQTIPTAVGFPSSSVKLDVETHQLITELGKMARIGGFRPGDDIIAVSYMPGIVFALGGRSPGHPAFLLWDKKYLNYSKIAIQLSDLSRRRKALLLINSDLTEDSLRDLLNSGGLDYPSRYRRIGGITAFGTDYTLYRPVD